MIRKAVSNLSEVITQANKRSNLFEIRVWCCVVTGVGVALPCRAALRPCGGPLPVAGL